MLDGLLGRGGFSSKCKSFIKPTKTRIEVLRRREEAKQRFLKEDLAKLLVNGLDINAYGRTEEFIAGQNIVACYNFIEQSCEYMLKQLSIMQKQGQCPEECRETVASLMFAAARFSDLPELRDLRDVFQERYGNGFECYVNQVFVEKLSSKPPAMEKRLKLLQDIALEFLIQWDSRAFKQRMDKPSTVAQDQAKKHGPLSVTDDKYKLPNGKNSFPESDKHSKERIDHVHDGPFVGREEKLHYNHNRITNKAESNRNGVNNEHLFRERQESAAKKQGSSTRKDDTPLIMKSSGSSTCIRQLDTLRDDRTKGLTEGKRGYKHERLTSKAETIENGENDDYLFKARLESAIKKQNDAPLMVKGSGSSSRDRMPEMFGNDMENAVDKGEMQDRLYHQKPEGAPNSSRVPVKEDEKGGAYVDVHVNRQNTMKSTGKVQDEEEDRSNFSYNNSFPPPYIKLNIPPPYSKPQGKGSKQTNFNSDDADGADMDTRAVGADVDNREVRIPKKQDSLYHAYGAQRGPKHGGFVSGGSSIDHPPHNASNSVLSSDRIPKQSDLGKDHHFQNEIPLPKPRSMRRKHSKSSSSHDDVGSSEDARIVKRISSSRRKERKGLQILFDDEHYHRDEEERMMDKLLLHYSKKPSAHDVGKLRKKSSRSNTSRSPHDRSRDEIDDEREMVAPPTRSISLPHESGESEPKKVFVRANSFQPDNQARHVHPKLPDYDDLAARFAALKGR